MKLTELLEEDNVPFNIKMLQKLLNKGEKVYMVRFTIGGEEANRILSADYTPATRNVGGGLRLKIAALNQHNEPEVRWLDAVHTIGQEGIDEFENRWVLRTVHGLRLWHMSDKSKRIDNLKDDLYVVELAD